MITLEGRSRSSNNVKSRPKKRERRLESHPNPTTKAVHDVGMYVNRQESLAIAVAAS